MLKKSGRRRNLAIAVGVALVTWVSLAACSSSSPGNSSSSPAGGDTTASIDFGVTGISASTVPLFAGEQEGFFAKHGIKLNIINAGQSQAVCEQLIANALQMGQCSMTDTIQAIIKGGPLVMIDNEDTTALPYDLVVGKGVKSWADLKGKTIMLGGPRDNTVYFFSLLAQAAGYSLSDFHYVYAGASSSRFAALISGSIQGTLLTLPYNSQAESNGYSKLAATGTVLNAGNYAGGGTSVATSYAKAHPGVIKGYVAAWRESMAWVYNPANKQAVINLMIKDGKATPSSAQVTYDALVTGKYWEENPTIDGSAVKGAEQSLYQVGFLTGTPPVSTKFYDTAFTS
jgi:NitT/TauT family transport system substrate-binding protein